MRALDIMQMRDKAMRQSVEDACIQVTLHRNGLQWNVDYRQVSGWIKALVKWHDKFTMVDLRDGHQVWPQPEEGDDLFHPRTLREASQMLHEGKAIVVPDVIQL